MIEKDFEETPKKIIGGDIELNPLSLKEIHSDSLFAPYSFFATGRRALEKILMIIPDNLPILVPLYICEDILESFKVVSNSIYYYQLTEDLHINKDIELLLDKMEGECAILTIDYFGIIEQKEIIFGLKEKYNNLIVIQDVSHSAFIPHLLGKYDYYGDYVFGSLRKLLPVPDGGFILTKSSIERIRPHDNSVLCIIKLASKMIKENYLKNPYIISPDIEQIYLDLSSYAEKMISTNKYKDNCSEVSYNILKCIDNNAVFQARRSNYITLRGLITDSIEDVSAALAPELKDCNMPYMLPLLFKNQKQRNDIRERLIRKRIFCPIIWDIHDCYKHNVQSISCDISHRILCIPIDQRYSVSDMHYVFSCLVNLLNK